MNSLTNDIQIMLVRELGTFAKEIELFPDDELVWKTMPGVTNSAGNLALHICGNLRHFIGAVLGGTGYVRNREAEFSTHAGTRTELIRQLAETTAVVSSVLPALSDETLTKDFPVKIGDNVIRCDRVLLHLCVHAGFHVGQLGYLRRVLTGQNVSADPIPLRPLAKL